MQRGGHIGKVRGYADEINFRGWPEYRQHWRGFRQRYGEFRQRYPGMVDLCEAHRMFRLNFSKCRFWV